MKLIKKHLRLLEVISLELSSTFVHFHGNLATMVNSHYANIAGSSQNTLTNTGREIAKFQRHYISLYRNLCQREEGG